MRKHTILTVCRSLLFIFISSFILIACSKQVNAPSQPGNSAKQTIGNFHLSESRLVLLRGNASNQAISFSWNALGNNETNYIVEADLAGASFTDPLQLVSTYESGASFTVKDFNSLMCRLLYANRTGRIEFRVRAASSNTDKNTSLSDAVALDVTTYQNYKEYNSPDVFKIPGNYQGWNLNCAPQIVSSPGAGNYEGYVNFSNPYPELLMIKGNDWEVRNTYSYIGSDKFGFGGSVLSVFGGAGVYLFKASTNTNQWGYTKINNWGITGSAVPVTNNTDPVMTSDEKPLSFSITTNLVKGDFRIRANNNNTVSFGHKASDEAGVPSYDGDNIVIKTAGNYTITLELGVAGNYAYSVQKNN